MHQALLVYEILIETFKHVNEIDWEGPLMMSYTKVSAVRRSLAALAATCKTFYEPAMNELWADIDGLNPLLGCVTRLRPIIYCAKRTWYNPPYFGDVDPLSVNEARQFLRHAARVRSMHIESATIRDLRLLSVLPPKKCMFPRLQLLFTASIPCPTRYMYLFLSPALRRCDLWVVDLDLKLIATRCAALEHLSMVHADSTIADEMSLLSDSIRLCKRLVTLHCPPINWAAWEHLSNLTTLRTVMISMYDVVPSPSDFNNITFGPFLNLTTLSVLANTAAYIMTLMQYSEFPSLKKIEFSIRRLPWVDAEWLFRAMSQCKACQTLEHIMIQSYGSGFRNPDSSWTAITQFRCCPQLRTLKLSFPGCCVHLENNHLLEAMSCWPHIRSLILADQDDCQATITFRGLLTALRQCPLLDELRMLIDTVNIDVDPTAESLRHTSLQLLNVCSAQVVDTEAVAHIIFSLLPCVDKIYHSPLDYSQEKKWGEVRNHLKHFKSSAVLECQDAAEGI